MQPPLVPSLSLSRSLSPAAANRLLLSDRRTLARSAARDACWRRRRQPARPLDEA